MLKFPLLQALILISLNSLLACQSTTGSRQPNNVQFEYDSAKVQLLTWAAQNRIMFQFPEATFGDVALVHTKETCKTLKEPVWSEAVFSTLENIKKNAALQNKIHVIEVKRTEKPQVEISKDLDGVTYLILGYSASETKSVIRDISQVPCETDSAVLVGEEKTAVDFNLPSKIQISKAISELPARITPDRWKFKTDFPLFLVKNMTVLKFTSELGFERSADGQFFFVQFLEDQAQLMGKNQFHSFNFWLSEIAQRSHAGSYLKIVALISDKQLTYGMAASQQSQGLAYPFLSYKSQEGKYSYTSLKQLNSCLDDLSNKYKRGLASIRSDLSTQADTFLYPGHICHTEKP